jgi:hypothetical protein
MMAMPMPAAISPYSIAVAADSSARKALIIGKPLFVWCANAATVDFRS